MTLSYGVTRRGMTEQILEACKESNISPTWDQAWFLATKILDVAAKLLPRPMQAMHCMRDLAGNCADTNLPLRWVTLTGLPVGNSNYESKTTRAALKGPGAPVTCE